MYELAALGAATLWAFAGILAADLTRSLGGVAFTRIRSYAALALLIALVTLMGLWHTLQDASLWLIVLSGLVGISLGDSAMFSAMSRLGPRRAQILYSMNAPLTVILSVFLLSVGISYYSALGVFLVFSGVAFAIWQKKATGKQHAWERTQGALLIGLSLGALAAISQAVGSIIIKPVLDAGVHPMVVATLRVATSTSVLLIAHQLLKKPSDVKPTRKQYKLLSLNGLMAVGLGTTLLMYAFSKGNVGLAAVLSATTPVIMLPIIWFQTGECPKPLAWLGAFLTVVGTSLIVLFG